MSLSIAGLVDPGEELVVIDSFPFHVAKETCIWHALLSNLRQIDFCFSSIVMLVTLDINVNCGVQRPLGTEPSTFKSSPSIYLTAMTAE